MGKDLREAEENNTPTISLEDAKNIREFFNHFKVGWDDELEAVLTAFEKEQTFVNQEAMKKVICRVVVTSGHDAFKDKMFTNVFKKSEDVTYREQFDKDLEEVLESGKSAEGTTEKP